MQLTVALDAARRVRAGEQVELWFAPRPAQLHLFAPESGESRSRRLVRPSLREARPWGARRAPVEEPARSRSAGR